MITQSGLRKLLEYNPDTGEFLWLASPNNRVKIGDCEKWPNYYMDFTLTMGAQRE